MTRRDQICLFIARHMPRWLVYWCAVVLGAEVTTGKFSTTVVPDLTFMDALKRYERGYSTLAIVLIVILVLLLIGGWPTMGFHGMGYGVSGFAVIALVVVLILILTGRL